jgi:hypothetical protein
MEFTKKSNTLSGLSMRSGPRAPAEQSSHDERFVTSETTLSVAYEEKYKVKWYDIVLSLVPLSLLLINDGNLKIFAAIIATAINFYLVKKYREDLTLKILSPILVTLLSWGIFLFLRIVFIHTSIWAQ